MAIWMALLPPPHFSPALFGIGGALILLLFLGVLWSWARIRSTLSEPQMLASNVQMVGHARLPVSKLYCRGRSRTNNFNYTGNHTWMMKSTTSHNQNRPSSPFPNTGWQWQQKSRTGAVSRPGIFALSCDTSSNHSERDPTRLVSWKLSKTFFIEQTPWCCSTHRFLGELSLETVQPADEWADF